LSLEEEKFFKILNNGQKESLGLIDSVTDPEEKVKVWDLDVLKVAKCPLIYINLTVTQLNVLEDLEDKKNIEPELSRKNSRRC